MFTGNKHIVPFSNMHNEQILKEISIILWGILPPDAYPSGLSTYPFMWQYKVPQETYKKLLREINRLDFSIKNLLSHDIEGYINQTTNVARAIALVISEWYKRDSHGLDGDGAMDIFTNGEIPSPVKIWDAAGFDQSLLHKAKKARLCQTAMCVMGGFPLNYVNDKEERFEELINTLAEDDDERNKYSWDELFDDNNSVFSGSLKCGSCKEYLDTLWHYLESEDSSFLPFNDRDCK